MPQGRQQTCSAGFVGKTLNEFVHLHGYSFGSKPGRLPFRHTLTAAQQAVPESAPAAHREPMDQGCASAPHQSPSLPVGQSAGQEEEGGSRPTKKHCTRQRACMSPPGSPHPGAQAALASKDGNPTRDVPKPQDGRSTPASITPQVKLARGNSSSQATLRCKFCQILMLTTTGAAARVAATCCWYQGSVREACARCTACITSSCQFYIEQSCCV